MPRLIKHIELFRLDVVCEFDPDYFYVSSEVEAAVDRVAFFVICIFDRRKSIAL